MTLVNRVSAYFLVALAIVLAVCSALFYGILRRQYQQQFDQQLRSTLQALVAAAEVEPEEAKWQPSEHIIGLGADDGPGEVRWAVIGDDDVTVESSRNASKKFLRTAKEVAQDATGLVTEVESPVLRGWRFVRQRRAAPAPDRQNRELDEYDAIVIVAARSTERLDADLSRIAALATLLPLGGWLAAAAAGRAFCRRALQPVLTMSREARSMTGADFGRRLPVSAKADELSDLALSFNSVLDRLGRSYDAQRRFTGDAAHELRTPLTVLLGQIDVALRKQRTPEEYQQTLAVLRDEGTELHQIVESLLFLARAEEDALPPETTTVELADWLPEYLVRWVDHPRYSNLTVQVEEPAAATVSPPLLRRLLDNLLGNALKYSPLGTPIIVSLARSPAETTISITDHGAGIAPEDVGSIFDPFFRSQSARTSGAAGVGLGLAIAARIAGAMHGRLTCASELGSGSRFSLHLPAVAS